MIRVVDFETTGMPEDDGAAICEIGWCDVDLDRASILPPESVLVDPGIKMPAQAQAVHHISDEDLAGAIPCDVGLHKLTIGEPEYFVAHNAKFEQAFFAGAGIPWICTYKVALRLWPEAPSHSNQVLRYWLGLVVDPELAMPPHRAGPDAYVTAHILLRAFETGKATLDDMARWSSGPPLLPRVTFGKHRGADWDDVPADYLEWIVFKSEMDNDIKANARHHLKKRSAS